MRTLILLALCLLLATTYAQEFHWDSERLPTRDQDPIVTDQTGNASFYADYYEGNPTALGEIYHGNEFTAAHSSLPLGTMVQVTRLDNGLSTIVRINDRGAYCEGCLVHLSQAAAAQIDLIRIGRTRVKMQVIGYAEQNPTPANSSETGRFVPRSATPNSYSNKSYTAPDRQLTARTPVSYSNTQSARYVAPQSSPAQSDTHSPNEVQLLANLPKGYAVQLGSYGDLGNAERHVINLQQKGFNNIYVWQERQANGGVLNRVVVTPFQNSRDAQNYLADLKRFHNLTGLVVRMD